MTDYKIQYIGKPHVVIVAEEQKVLVAAVRGRLWELLGDSVEHKPGSDEWDTDRVMLAVKNLEDNTL